MGRSTTRGQPDPASHALPVGKGVREQRLPSEVGQNPRAGEAAKWGSRAWRPAAGARRDVRGEEELAVLMED